MREFVVSEAPLERVAAHARTCAEEVGGVVAQHTERTTEFDHLRTEEGDWSRSGYIGTYQRYGEQPVRLRIRVWAEWPRKFFLWSILLGLVEAVLFFTLSLVQLPPPPNVWIFTAILTFALIGISFLLYATSWADSADLEDEIARKLTARARDDEEIPGDVYTLSEWEEHRETLVEEKVEAAKREAPERPSRAKQLVRSVTAGGSEAAGQLMQRARPEDEEDEEPAAEPEEPSVPEREAVAAAEEEGEEDERGLLDRVAFWRSGSEDEEDEQPAAEQEPPQAEPEAEEDTDEGGLLDRVAFWRSVEEDAGEEPAGEAEAGQEPAEAGPPPEDEEDDEDETGLLDRMAFWRSSEGTPEEPEPEGEDEAGDDLEAKRERLEELKRRKQQAAETDEDAEPEED